METLEKANQNAETTRDSISHEGIARQSTHGAPINHKDSPMPGTTIPPASPLDPLMTGFLQQIDTAASGFLPGSQSKTVADALDIPDALIDALFVSARTRNLIQPDFSSRIGRRTPWILSQHGRDFLTRHSTPNTTGDNPA
jgi:hypothetical protein